MNSGVCQYELKSQSIRTQEIVNINSADSQYQLRSLSLSTQELVNIYSGDSQNELSSQSISTRDNITLNKATISSGLTVFFFKIASSLYVTITNKYHLEN